MIYTIVLRTPTGSLDKLISFDSITGFSEGVSAQVSKNTVESGFPISDHTTLDNKKISFSGIVTAYSVFDDNLELSWDGSEFVSVGGDSTNNENRHIKIEQDLKAIIEDRRVFALLRSHENSSLSSPKEKLKALETTQVELIENCVATSISFKQQSGVSGAIFPDISIEQVRVAVTQVIPLTGDEMSPRLQAQKANLGSASTTKKADGDDATKTGETPDDKTQAKKGAEKSNEQKRLESDIEGVKRQAEEVRRQTEAIRKQSIYIRQGGGQ